MPNGRALAGSDAARTRKSPLRVTIDFYVGSKTKSFHMFILHTAILTDAKADSQS